MTGRAAIWMLLACSAALAQLQLTDSTGNAYAPGQAIDLGGIGTAGTTAAFQITNTGTAGVTLNTLTIQGQGFSLALSGTPPPALPLTLDTTASLSFTVTLTPSGVGAYSATLSINQNSYLVFANVLPFHIAVTPGTLESGQQATVSVVFDVVPASADAGTLEWDFQAPPGGAAGDMGMGLLLPAPSNELVPPRGSVAFNIGAGQNAAQFVIDSSGDTAASLTFQTGSTAGTVLFTVALGGDSTQASFPIAPAPVWMDTILLNTGPGAITLDVSGWDNTRSASQVSFTFLDSGGNILGGGPISADVSSDFEEYFQNPPLGGEFELRAAFVVTGDTSQVNSVTVQFTNSAGVSSANATIAAE
jgi:hypothetical protein